MTETTTTDTGTILADAASALASAVSSASQGGAPASPAPAAPPPAAPATPAAAPATTPAAGPAPAAPETPAPAVQPVPTLTVNDPAAQRYLEMYGGDPNKALAKALADNNRLAALAKAHPELFNQPGTEPAPAAIPEPAPAAPGTTAPPGATPPVPATEPVPTPQPVAAPDPQVIATELNERTQTDPEVQGIIATFAQNSQAIQQHVQTYNNLTQEIAYTERRLEEPDIKADEIRAADLRDKLREMKLDRTTALQEYRFLTTENRELDAQFRQHRQRFHQEISEKHQREAEEQALTATLQQTETQSFNELKTAWPAAIQRVATALALPADMVADFKAEAKNVVLARMSDTSFTLDPATLDSLLTPIAQGFRDRLDRYHRAQSALYATQATQRAASPAPAVPSPGSAPAATTAPIEPDAIFDRANAELSRGLRRR